MKLEDKEHEKLMGWKKKKPDYDLYITPETVLLLTPEDWDRYQKVNKENRGNENT